MKRKKSGISLVELMFSVSILVFVFFVLTGIMCLLMKGNQKTIDRSSGVITANSILEKHIEAKRYFLEARIEGKEIYENQEYAYVITTEKLDQGLYNVNITVKWIEFTGKNGKNIVEYKMSTLVNGETLAKIEEEEEAVEKK